MSTPLLHEISSKIESALGTGSPETTASLAGLEFRASRKLDRPGSFTLEPRQGATVSSRNLLEALLGTLPRMLPDLQIGTLVLDADSATSTYILHVPMVGVWTVPLGISSLEISEVVATVTEKATDLSGQIVGQFSLCSQSIRVEAKLPGGLVLTGDLPPVDLLALIESVAGRGLSLPAGVPSFKLGASTVEVGLSEESPRFVVRSTVDGFGSLVAVVAKVGGDWESLAGFALPADWRFSKLAPFLGPLDALKIESPRLVLSSFASDAFAIPEVGGVAFDPNVTKGLSFLADLKLEGGALQFVGQLFGLSDLPLQLSASDAISNAVVSAKLPGSKDLLPGVLTIKNFALGIRPEPLTFTPSAEALVNLFGSELPRFRISVGVTLGVGTPQLNLVTIEPWVNPAGIRGLTILQTGLSLKAAPPDYGVLGDVSVGGKRAALEVHFATESPTFLKAEILDRLALGEVVKDLVRLALPSTAMDLSIQDFKILVVAAPTDTVTGEHYDPGLMLQGTFGAVGLEMFVKIRVDPSSGVFAHGALNRSVEVGGIFKVSNAAGDGPPSMTLDTTSPRILRLTGRASLLGLSESIDATVEATGFSASFDQDLGLEHYKIDARYSSPVDVSAGGECRYGIDLVTPPIQLAPGTPSVGSLKISAGFIGAIALAAKDHSFSADVTGGFRWNGEDYKLEPIHLSVAPSSFSEIRGLIDEAIRKNAATIFASLLQDGNRWLKAFAAGLVQGVENSAKVLKDTYNFTAEKAATCMRGVGDTGAAVRQKLTDAGFTAEQVNVALHHLPDHLDTILAPHGDVPAQVHLDTILAPHGDVPAQVHLDTILAPHGDVPAQAHLDTILAPHGNTPAQAHFDTILAPHGNTPAQAHVDRFVGGFSTHQDVGGGRFHVDKHQNSPGTHIATQFVPHGDIPPVHGDTPLVPHGDIPAVHGDTPLVPHGNIPAVHGDTPLVPHGNIPAVHGDTPLVPHGDIPAVHTDLP